MEMCGVNIHIDDCEVNHSLLKDRDHVLDEIKSVLNKNPHLRFEDLSFFVDVVLHYTKDSDRRGYYNFALRIVQYLQLSKVIDLNFITKEDLANIGYCFEAFINFDDDFPWNRSWTSSMDEFRNCKKESRNNKGVCSVCDKKEVCLDENGRCFYGCKYPVAPYIDDVFDPVCNLNDYTEVEKEDGSFRVIGVYPKSFFEN